MRVTPTVGLWPRVGCSQKEADGPIEVGAPWCVFEEMCFTETPALSLRDSVKPRATAPHVQEPEAGFPAEVRPSKPSLRGRIVFHTYFSEYSEEVNELSGHKCLM